MNQPTRQEKTAKQQEEPMLRINLEGSPELVARLLTGMASMLNASQESAQTEPEQLYLTRREASIRSGISEARLSNMVKAGRLTNYGTPGRLLLSLADIRNAQ